MNDASGLNLPDEVYPAYNNEFRSHFSNHQTKESGQFCLINGNYMAVDAHVYYGLIIHFKPKRIVEIGAGNSTLLSAATSLEKWTRDRANARSDRH